MSTISVIVPVYNVERYLCRCVDSILAQTFADFELILVDDGSPDNCPAMCDEYAVKDARIHVIHKENGGLSDARNVGLDWIMEHSQSEWITFVDSDDWIHERMLSNMLAVADTYETDLVLCEHVRTNGQPPAIEDNGPCEVWEPDEYWMHYNTNAVHAMSKLYRRKLFENIRYPVGRLYEDAFTTHKILFQYRQLYVLRQSLYFYYVNEAGIMHLPFSLKTYDDLEASEERLMFFEKHQIEKMVSYETRGIEVKKAVFALRARKAGVYKHVPEKYRMGWFEAMKIVSEKLDRDRYEAVMMDCYPLLVKCQAYYRCVKRKLTHKKE